MTRIENKKLLKDAAVQLRRHSALEKIMTPPGQWWPKDYSKPGSWMLAAAELLESEAREMTGCENGAWRSGWPATCWATRRCVADTPRHRHRSPCSAPLRGTDEP